MPLRDLDPVLAPLNLDFRIRVIDLVSKCLDQGIDMKVYCGVRTAQEQAILYRKSRGKADIARKAQSLRDKELPFLADILYEVGPQSGKMGKHVTKAGPGESWHQYGLAIDSVPILYGKAIWESDSDEWEVYGAVAKYLGLNWAGTWQTFKEMPHVQMHPIPSPLSFFKTPDKVLENLKVSL